MAAPKRTSAVAVTEKAVSKTARKSSANRAGKAEGFKASGDMNRIISLNNGEHAYLMDPRTGLTHHLATNSEEWNTLVTDLIADATHGPRIQAEINSMRRSKIYDRFVALTELPENQPE